VVLSGAPAPTWARFYAERRLGPLVAMAARRGALPAGAAAAIERVCDRMDALAGPPEPPARLHGDLWTGNVMTTADGVPALVDPAAHGGHRETDLAMLRLFGGPSKRCFAAYAEAAPLAEGHAERVALWQLQPLLVHAVLFGGGYGAAAARAAARYA
jgi:fructosamine-3-kinase